MPDHSSKPILRQEHPDAVNKPSIPELNQVTEEGAKTVNKVEPVKQPASEPRPGYMTSHTFNPFSIF